MSDGGMTWEPPTTSRHGINWEEVHRLLVSRPGEWLKIFDEGPVSVANAIRGNGIMLLRPYLRPGAKGEGYEVRTRNNNATARTCTLYVRYLREED